MHTTLHPLIESAQSKKNTHTLIHKSDPHNHCVMWEFHVKKKKVFMIQPQWRDLVSLQLQGTPHHHPHPHPPTHPSHIQKNLIRWSERRNKTPADAPPQTRLPKGSWDVGEERFEPATRHHVRVKAWKWQGTRIMVTHHRSVCSRAAVKCGQYLLTAFIQSTAWILYFSYLAGKVLSEK